MTVEVVRIVLRYGYRALFWASLLCIGISLWYGGSVDRLTMSLRVHATGDDCAEVSRLLGREFAPYRKHSGIQAPEVLNGDLDSMIADLLATLTADLAVWSAVTSRWKIDIFCGVFLERKNRGIELSAQSMRLLSERGILLGFDIYAPDEL